MVLVQKWPFFQLFYFRQYKPGKCLLRYSRAKKRLSRVWKQEVKTWNIDIFPKGLTHRFWWKNGHFFNFFFLAKENVFYDIQEQKNAFVVYEKQRFKKSKDWHFSKGVNLRVLSKNLHFSNFFFYAI